LYIGMSIAGAYICISIGLRHISAYIAGVLVVFEPVFAVLFAVLFFGEMLSTTTMLGLSSILVAFFLLQLSQSN